MDHGLNKINPSMQSVNSRKKLQYNLEAAICKNYSLC